MNRKLLSSALIAGLLAGSVALAQETAAAPAPTKEKKHQHHGKKHGDCSGKMKKDGSCKGMKKKDNNCSGKGGCEGKDKKDAPKQ